MKEAQVSDVAFLETFTHFKLSSIKCCNELTGK